MCLCACVLGVLLYFPLHSLIATIFSIFFDFLPLQITIYLYFVVLYYMQMQNSSSQYIDVGRDVRKIQQNPIYWYVCSVAQTKTIMCALNDASNVVYDEMFDALFTILSKENNNRMGTQIQNYNYVNCARNNWKIDWQHLWFIRLRNVKSHLFRRTV